MNSSLRARQATGTTRAHADLSRLAQALTRDVLPTARRNGHVRVNVHLDTRINGRNRLTQLLPALDEVNGFDGPQLGRDFKTINILWFPTMWPFPYLQRQSRAVGDWRRGSVRVARRSHAAHRHVVNVQLSWPPFKLDWL